MAILFVVLVVGAIAVCLGAMVVELAYGDSLFLGNLAALTLLTGVSYGVLRASANPATRISVTRNLAIYVPMLLAAMTASPILPKSNLALSGFLVAVISGVAFGHYLRTYWDAKWPPLCPKCRAAPAKFGYMENGSRCLVCSRCGFRQEVINNNDD